MQQADSTHLGGSDNSDEGQEHSLLDSALGLSLRRDRPNLSQGPHVLYPHMTTDGQLNITNVLVRREDKRQIQRLYPNKGGAYYVFPSRGAFMRHNLLQQEARRQAPDYELFGKPAHHVLPPFMRNVTIDHDTVQQVHEILYDQDGSLKVAELCRDLKLDLAAVFVSSCRPFSILPI